MRGIIGSASRFSLREKALFELQTKTPQMISFPFQVCRAQITRTLSCTDHENAPISIDGRSDTTTQQSQCTQTSEHECLVFDINYPPEAMLQITKTKNQTKRARSNENQRLILSCEARSVSPHPCFCSHQG